MTVWSNNGTMLRAGGDIGGPSSINSLSWLSWISSSLFWISFSRLMIPGMLMLGVSLGVSDKVRFRLRVSAPLFALSLLSVAFAGSFHLSMTDSGSSKSGNKFALPEFREALVRVDRSETASSLVALDIAIGSFLIFGGIVV
jgi:hypothetical protein